MRLQLAEPPVTQPGVPAVCFSWRVTLLSAIHGGLQHRMLLLYVCQHSTTAATLWSALLLVHMLYAHIEGMSDIAAQALCWCGLCTPHMPTAAALHIAAASRHAIRGPTLNTGTEWHEHRLARG